MTSTRPEKPENPENPKIFIALDSQSAEQIEELVSSIPHGTAMYKVNDAFTQHGPEIVKKIKKLGGNVFLDLKWHDIPNTVANYIRTAADLGVFCCTIHCLGGFEMMQTAVKALDALCLEPTVRPKLLGITILTSMDNDSLKEDLLLSQNVESMVKHLALKAKEAGLDGVVCSPWEVEIVREVCGRDFLIVTPGIRPNWACSDDQKRIMTPREAIEKGADYLVIGRPITQSNKYGLTRGEALERIKKEIE